MSLDFSLYLEVDAGGDEPHRVVFFSRNITHNLTTMADEAGIYKALWRADETCEVASELIPTLTLGLETLKGNPEHFEKFNAKNGWGLYEHFVPFVEACRDACVEFPKAKVHSCT